MPITNRKPPVELVPDPRDVFNGRPGANLGWVRADLAEAFQHYPGRPPSTAARVHRFFCDLIAGLFTG